MAEETGQAGTIQAVGERGVWVPKGLDGADILAAAAALEQTFDVGPYQARHMASTVLLIVKSRRE